MKDKLIAILKNKRIILVIVLILIALAIGLTTYAVWTTYFSQSDTSSITAKCFKTSFYDGAGINITDMYPTTDADGMITTPYNFTISNTCNTVAQYQINIEILNTTTLEEQYVKVALDQEISLLSTNEVVTPTLNNATKSYKLKTGVLAQGDRKTFNLRTWLDENTTGEQGSNKIFETRVTITTTPVANINFLKVSEITGWGNLDLSDDPFLGSPIQRQQIEAIEFVNHKTIPATATGSWDVSAAQYGGIMAWYEPIGSNGRYKVTIGSNEQIYANQNSSYLFNDLRNLDSLDFNNLLDTSFITNMGSMFNGTGENSLTFALDLGDNFDTSNVTTMRYTFMRVGYNSLVFTLNLGGNFDTSNVTNMDQMFSRTGYNSNVFTLDLGDNFDTSNVTNMNSMFWFCGYSNTNFTLNLGEKFDTSSVTNMQKMFQSVGQNSTNFTLDLGDKFDTSNIPSMSSMFSGVGENSTTLTLNLGEKFDTSNVTNMYHMFNGTGENSLTFALDLGNQFDTSNVTNMNSMFSDTGSNSTNFTLDLGEKFDTSNVTNMYRMFWLTGLDNTVFTLNLGNKFNMSKVTDAEDMFVNVGAYNPNFTIYAPTATITYLLDNRSAVSLKSSAIIIDCNDTPVC